MGGGKILEGKVVSDKMDKTIVVEVRIHEQHPIYKRAMINRKKYKVHDKENKAKEGDRVKIIESRPYSKEKCFRLLEVLK
jgi:small subunit ribosomal protein S17